MPSPLTADEVIAELKLVLHPEGGHYRETFRDEPGHKGRPHSTAILFLLKAGESGAPLLLEVRDGEARHEYRLGPNWLGGEHPQALVPAGAWAKREEPWALDATTLHRGAWLRLRGAGARLGALVPPLLWER